MTFIGSFNEMFTFEELTTKQNVALTLSRELLTHHEWLVSSIIESKPQPRLEPRLAGVPWAVA